MYSDGGGLCLQVRRNSKAWVFRFTSPSGKARTMGLGSLILVSLAEARDMALDARKLVRRGIDPIEQRKAEQHRSDSPTFSEAAAQYIIAQRNGWRNAKHASQWENTITTYANPIIGKMSVGNITIEHVLKILQPIWETKHETASRLRGRIERILDWATSREYREGPNPARWAGRLEFSLSRRPKRTRHHPALPWPKLSDFCTELASQSGQAAQALLFTILTAARTNETRGARWDEFDLEADVPVWRIPAERMKSRREHRVPLAPAVLALLNELPRFTSGYLFEGRAGKPLSENAMLAVLKRMGRSDITVHGFRSTFRDWCAEATSFSREVAEVALAHINKDRVEAAYLRGDALEKRVDLMQAWANFATSPPEARVVKLSDRASSRQ